jgi:hypothetical protein
MAAPVLKAPFPYFGNALDYCLWLVDNGVLSVDGEGRIWRHAIISHGRFVAIPSRRAENVGGKGYLRVSLQMDGKLRCVMAHRVVYATRYGPPPAAIQINHKDLDKRNNRLDNLELVTQSGNIQHSYANGRARPWSVDIERPWRGRRRCTPDRVNEIIAARRDGALLKDVALAFGISVSHVHRLCKEGRTANGGS